MRLLHGIEFDNTKSIKDKCDSGEYSIPGIKGGNERYSHNIGDRVASTNLSTIRAGEMGTVVSREMNNGYCRYFVEFDCGTRSTQREQDLYGKEIEYKKLTPTGEVYYKDAEMTIKHRIGKPACVWDDGTKFWMFDNMLHRVDGPAKEWNDGSVEYYICGKEYTEAEVYFIQRHLNKVKKVIDR